MAVAAGAFGAHVLEDRLAPESLAVFDTGVRYQMYHAIGLFAVAWAEARWSGRATPLAGWFFIAGILVFSGSLYALAFGAPRILGAVAPVGGVAFLSGWTLLAVGATARRKEPAPDARA